MSPLKKVERAYNLLYEAERDLNLSDRKYMNLKASRMNLESIIDVKREKDIKK